MQLTGLLWVPGGEPAGRAADQADLDPDLQKRLLSRGTGQIRLIRTTDQADLMLIRLIWRLIRRIKLLKEQESLGIRLQRWYITIPSSDQWCATIKNHHFQWLSYPKTIGKPLIPMVALNHSTIG